MVNNGEQWKTQENGGDVKGSGRIYNGMALNKRGRGTYHEFCDNMRQRRTQMTGVDVGDTRAYERISARDDVDIMEWDPGI